MKTFIAECQRRRVFRVAALYIVAAWIVLQVADLAFDNWGIPSEAMRFVWIGTIVGLPIPCHERQHATGRCIPASRRLGGPDVCVLFAR